MLRTSLSLTRAPAAWNRTQVPRLLCSNGPLPSQITPTWNGVRLLSLGYKAGLRRTNVGALRGTPNRAVRRYSEKSGKSSEGSKGGAKREGAERTDVTVRKQTALQTTAQKTKEGGIMLFAIAGMVGLAYGAYIVASDYLSSASPQRIYGQACKMLKKDEEVQKILGNKIKCYGDESENRSRRKNVRFEKYISQKGVEHVNVMFYARGENGVAEVYVDALTKNGKFFSFVMIAPFCGERLVYTRKGVFERK